MKKEQHTSHEYYPKGHCDYCGECKNHGHSRVHIKDLNDSIITLLCPTCASRKAKHAQKMRRLRAKWKKEKK